MNRTLHLGAEGEDAARHLEDVYDLSSTFEPCLILSSHAEAPPFLVLHFWCQAS